MKKTAKKKTRTSSAARHTEPQPVLNVQSVTAGYEEITVLHDVSIKIFPGEIVALIGPNGAGKSTLLKAVYGMTERSAGNIHFKGFDVTTEPAHSRQVLGMSYITQGKINWTELTVEENLALGGLFIREKAELKRRIEDVYNRFPILRTKKHDHAFSLSGGQHQMLAIGRALVQKPQLLLMDEPSLGLSPKLQQELFVIIRGLRDEGMSILIVEQNAKKAIETADRTYLLEQGKIVLTGGKEILQNTAIKKVYLGG